MNNKIFFLLLNEDVNMLLKFKKKFHKYLITYMVHLELRKREDRLEQNKFFCALVKSNLCSNRRKIAPCSTDSKWGGGGAVGSRGWGPYIFPVSRKKNQNIGKRPPCFLCKVNKYTNYLIYMTAILSFPKKREQLSWYG